MPTVFVGIGSNLGNRIENCAEAIRKISGFAAIFAISSIYETEPVGNEDQPNFINCAVKIETDLSPYDLLSSLQSIEDNLGRERVQKLGPRTIDLDILFYNNLVIESDELIIPHPSAHLRRFVLEPLSEIAPYLIHPVLKVSISNLLEGLNDPKSVVKLGSFSTGYQQ
ncbi:MAG TPA: 2-amino-4-hydroxy-6-hydroxymethyldihydropteridine diphosphokinase [Thermodesulfobacteriota bacterium]|nr:2-amino-4-hydroxy-6-hydroxymethyldihydropteridine diphosphokinase [Thermodesulfobacteriota bacterium]